MIGSAPAQAGLDGATVQSASYFNVSFPPPAASPTECTIIDCTILDYNGPGGPTNSPLPTVPVTYLEDFLTLTTVSVGDTQITITNDFAGQFGTPGSFSGYMFTFTGAPDITNVQVDSGSSSDFQPVLPGGLSSTATSITVNVAGDNLAVGDQLILDVTTGTTGVFTRTVSGNWTDTTGWTPNGVPNGATVTAQLVNPASGTNNVDLGGETFTVNQLQFSGINAGTWSVRNGTIVFDGTNPIFLNQGDSSGLAGSLPNLTLNATTIFEIDNASAVTDVTGDITGTGGLTKTGAGTLTLTGANTYSGGTTVNGGTLLGGAANAFSAASATTINTGGTVDLGGFAQTINNVALAGGAIKDGSLTGAIASTGGTVNGVGGSATLTTTSGTTTLLGANTYTGATTVNGGTLLGGAANAFSAASATTINTGGTVDLGGFNQTVTSLAGAGAATNSGANNAVLTNQGASSTFAGAITDGATHTTGLTQAGPGTLTLTGTNTYSGGTTISAGTLQIGNGGTTGSIIDNVLDNSALAFDRSDNVTFGGVVSGTGSVTQLGAGTLTLTGTNTYAGGTTISAGTLQIGGAGSLGAGNYAGAITDNGTFEYSSSANQTLSGVISGTGTLSKDTSATSTLLLTGTNTYSGGTTISAGTLQIGNGGTTGSIVGNVLDNGALAFDRFDNVTFGGGVSGTGSLTQLGAGTLLLTGTNTYAGGTTISAGTLQIGNGGTTGSVVGNVLDNSALAFDRSDNLTFGGVISGTGSLTQLGAGTLTLTGTNTYAGGTNLSGGIVAVDSDGNLGTGALSFNGGTLEALAAGGGITSNKAVTLNAGGGAFLADAGTTSTLSGAISGPGSLTKDGSGALTLTGTNTYAGGTTISAGTLQIGGAGSLGAGNYAGAITDNGTFEYSSSANQTLSGVISGTGTLSKDTSATSTLLLTGTNTYSGGTTISAGTLQIGNGGTTGSIVGNVLDNGALAFDRFDNVTFGGGVSGTGSLTQLGAGTLLLTGTNTYAGGTTISAGTLQIGNGGTTGSVVGNVLDNSALAFDRSDNLTFGGVISGTGSLTQLGAGTLTLTGTNTYAGGTNLSGGIVAVDSDGNLGTGALSFNGGTLEALAAGGGITSNKAVTLNAGGGAFLADAGTTSTLSGAISGPGSLTKDGSGALTLTGTNTYAGGTTISAGTLQIGGAGSLGAGNYAGAITDNGTFEYSSSANQTLSGVISGTGTLSKDTSATSTLLLTGTNTYSGGTTISAGTLQIGNGGTTGSIVGNVLDNGALAFDRFDNVTFGGGVSGTGSLTQLGAGTLLLTGTNTYAGGTTISAGTLQIGNGGTTGSVVGNVLDNSALAFDRSDNLTFGGVISGTGSLTQLGAGTLTLTGTNTYAGGTNLSGGIVAVDSDGNLGTGALSFNGGTLEALAARGGITSNKAVTLNAGGGAFLADAGTTSTLSGAISGPGSLTKDGSGALTLTGTNTYAGGTTISAGTLQIGGAGSLGAGSYAGAITDNGTFEYSSSANQTLSGVISGTGTLSKDTSATSTLFLTGANTYSGGTTISAGTLQIGNGGTTGSIVGNVLDNGALAFDRFDNVTFGGVISGTGSLTQLGAGTLLLTGANTYTGGTFLDAGTLGIDSNGDLGAGPLMMQPGTTLRFEASGLNLPNTVVLRNADPTIDTGANTDTISGVISGPGSLAKIGSGTLILSAANTYAEATDVQAGTLAVTGSIVSSATVETGATLGGSGTIGGLVAKSGATIAPGVLAPFSTLTVNGAASFAARSIFAVNVNAAGQNDKLVTTGATTISGGTVQVAPAPGTFAPQTRYTLITAGGGVSGAFSALTGLSSLAFLSPALSYDADDVFLGFSVKAAPSSTPLFASIAQTPNQSATALALQAQPPGSPLFDAIIGQTVAGAVTAFDALSGEVHASAVSAAFDDQRLPREAVFDRLATPYGGALAGGAQSIKTLAAPNPAQVFAAWGQALGSWGHIGGDGNAATLSNDLGGLIFGADATLQGRYRLGVAGGYDYSTLGLGARSSSANVSTTYVGLYGGLSDGALQVRGGGFYGYNHYGTSRSAVFPGFADALSSGYGGDTWQAFAEAGWRMPVGGLAAYSAWAEPFVGLTGLEIATRSFGESPGAAGLNGASATYNYGITTVGLRGEASLFAWAPLVANGMIGWQNVFGDVTPNSVLAFASAPNVPFAIAGAPIARNALAVEVGADWRFTTNVKLGIYYSGLIASNASDNAIKVKLEANF